MISPKIDERLYREDIRKKAQADLDRNYRDVGLTKTGKGREDYSFLIEAAQVHGGFAYYETVFFGNFPHDIPYNTLADNFGALDDSGKCVFGREILARSAQSRLNFRLVQPIPPRVLNSENNNARGFAVYIRFLMPKAEELKQKRPSIKIE